MIRDGPAVRGGRRAELPAEPAVLDAERAWLPDELPAQVAERVALPDELPARVAERVGAESRLEPGHVRPPEPRGAPQELDGPPGADPVSDVVP